MAWWYAAFAVYAAGLAVFSRGADGSWGVWAAAAYLAAALVAKAPRPGGPDVALVIGLGGALVTPLAWLAARAPATPDVLVVGRSATLLLRHGSPYLPAAQLAHAGVPAYNPYLPFMAVFGLPRALDLPGLAGDPRIWLTVGTVTVLGLAFGVARHRHPWRAALFAAASPFIAFPVALGITDPPVLALVCLALACVIRPARPLTAGVILGVACAMKATAWPAIPMVAVMLAARDGHRAAARLLAGVAGVLAVAAVPALRLGPATLVQNIVLFPLGLTQARTPAASPLPGYLLAATGPAGQRIAVCLLIAAAAGITASLRLRPPADTAQAARRLALALALLFTLAPATRLGYFAYPLGLCAWLSLTPVTRRRAPEAGPHQPGPHQAGGPRQAGSHHADPHQALPHQADPHQALPHQAGPRPRTSAWLRTTGQAGSRGGTEISGS